MEEGGMDDLGDGVSKLAEFSTVLSSVTRTLDKNVRRLESEFGKCNIAFKEMKVLVEEQKVVTDRLSAESAEQQSSLAAAVAANAEGGQPIHPSKFLSNELDAVIRLGSETISGGDAWSKIKGLSDTPARIVLDQAVNDAVHVLNKFLVEEYRKMAEKGTVNSKRIGKSTNPGQAIGALVQRLYDAENAIAMQSAINETLIKTIRDDTYLKNSHNHLNDLCVGLAKDVKEIREEHGKLVKTVEGVQSGLSALGASFERHCQAAEEVIRGGRLRVEKRKKRLGERGGGGGGGRGDGEDDEGDEEQYVEWGLDGFTLEESDCMLKKVMELEKRVFGPTGLEPKVATLDQSLGEVTADVVVLQQGQAETKAWIEKNSNELLNKVAALRVRWDALLGDINFGLNQFSNERDGEGEDTLFYGKLGDLYDNIASSLEFFSGNNKTEESMLDELCPRLDSISAQVDELFSIDAAVMARRSAGNSNREDVCFADILSINKFNQTIKEALEVAVNDSVYIVDLRIPKMHMKRRIETLEKTGVKKDDVDRLKAALKKGIEKQKTDNKVLTKELQTKAGLSDLKKLQDKIANGGFGGGGSPVRSSPPSPSPSVHEEPSVESLSTVEERWPVGMGDSDDDEGHGGRRQHSRGGGGGGGGGGGVVDAASAAVLNDMGLRLDLLVKQFKDLQEGCNLFVPREEVHEAMQAVLHEVKLVKLNSVNVNRFKAGLESKADAQEVQKLVVTLNTAVGDMMGTNVTAAGKAKCLLCDKPVGSVVNHVEKRSRRGDHSRSRSPDGRDAGGSSSLVDGSIASGSTRPTSQSSPSRQQLSKVVHEKVAKITSEITVLRSSIDLPLVDTSSSSPGGGAAAASAGGAKKEAYRQRIRASGAGGFGANYTENTR